MYNVTDPLERRQEAPPLQLSNLVPTYFKHRGLDGLSRAILQCTPCVVGLLGYPTLNQVANAPFRDSFKAIITNIFLTRIKLLQLPSVSIRRFPPLNYSNFCVDFFLVSKFSLGD